MLAAARVSKVAGFTAATSTSRPSRRSVVVNARSTTSGSNPGKEYMLGLPGICEPTGFWDPIGFTESPTFTVSEAKRFREAEVTHGRVAMLATLGWIVQEEYHPFFGGQIGGPAFQHFQEIEAIFPQFWELVLLAIGILETRRAATGWNPPPSKTQMRDDFVPGDIGFDPLGLTKDLGDEELYALKTKELNNGRLAMISWAAFATQEEVNHITIWKDLVTSHIVPAEDANLLPY